MNEILTVKQYMESVRAVAEGLKNLHVFDYEPATVDITFVVEGPEELPVVAATPTKRLLAL